MFYPKKIFKNEKKQTYCVLWDDDTKTLIRLQSGDRWDDEKALAICYMKKMFGNKGQFNDILNAWCGKATEDDEKSPSIEVLPDKKLYSQLLKQKKKEGSRLQPKPVKVVFVKEDNEEEVSPIPGPPPTNPWSDAIRPSNTSNMFDWNLTFKAKTDGMDALLDAFFENC